jgi:hypothetical protein
MSGVEPIIAAEVIGSAAAAEGAAAAASTALAAEAATAASAATAAQTAAAATGAANPFLASAYGSLPGMTMGSQQAAMLAAQTGEFGLPGLMSTGGSATYAGAGGPLAKMVFSSGTPAGMRMGMQGINMMQQSEGRQSAPPPGIKKGSYAPTGPGSLLAQPIQSPDVMSIIDPELRKKRISLL